MKHTNLLGPWGEALAADYLRRHGYRVVAANFRTRVGEIDLIARKDGFVAFIEVKLRADARFGEAREFVDYRKRERIRKTALLWLARHQGPEQPRFDVMEIYAPEGMKTSSPRIVYIENAFE